MGLTTKSNAKTTYVRVADGKLYDSTDKQRENPFDELEGTITDLYFREEEYNGDKTRKLNIRVNDESGESYVLATKWDSGASIVSFMKNVDVSKPLSFVPVSKTGEDGKSRGTILIKQDGKFAKNYYTKDQPNGLPEWGKVKVNGKLVPDKTDYLEFLENVLVTEIKPNLSKDGVGGSGGSATVTMDRKGAPTKAALKAKPVEVEEFDDSEESDLPF